MSSIPHPPDISCAPECRECGEGAEYFDEYGRPYCWDCGPIWTKPAVVTRLPEETEECAKCGEPMVGARMGELCGDCVHTERRDALPGGGYWQRRDGEWVCEACHPRPMTAR